MYLNFVIRLGYPTQNLTLPASNSISTSDWKLLLEALEGREADIMIEAKSKELALANLEIR